VLPQYKRQVMGPQMLIGLKYLFRLACICRFFLFAQKHNIAGCALYEKAGGEKTSSMKDVGV